MKLFYQPIGIGLFIPTFFVFVLTTCFDAFSKIGQECKEVVRFRGCFEGYVEQLLCWHPPQLYVACHGRGGGPPDDICALSLSATVSKANKVKLVLSFCHFVTNSSVWDMISFQCWLAYLKPRRLSWALMGCPRASWQASCLETGPAWQDPSPWWNPHTLLKPRKPESLSLTPPGTTETMVCNHSGLGCLVLQVFVNALHTYRL